METPARLRRDDGLEIVGFGWASRFAWCGHERLGYRDGLKSAARQVSGRKQFPLPCRGLLPCRCSGGCVLRCKRDGCGWGIRSVVWRIPVQCGG